MAIMLAKQLRKPSGLYGIFVSKKLETINDEEYKGIIGKLDIKEHEQLLEIGYGPGTGMQYLLQNSPTCYIDGIDFSKLMYKQASKRNKAYIKKKNVSLMYGDIIDYDFGTKTYHKIFGLNVTYFWDNLNTVFGKLYNLLEPGGFVVFCMADKDELTRMKHTNNKVFNKYSTDEVEAAFINNQFSTVEISRAPIEGFTSHYVKAYK